MKKFLLAILIAFPVLAFSQTEQHLKVSENFLEVSGAKSSFDDVVNTMLSTQTQAVPAEHRDKFTKVMKAFFAKYFSYDILKPKMAKMYAEEFSEKELKDLTAFYTSETGKKFASKLGFLTKKGMEIGQAAVEEHKDELTKMIQAEFGQ
ncbi:MAG: DUF2059 domain-containing protein [Pedobacter sp.]|nr:MAG: DUF2059 domain-containing protein [Pedobacter sp.]